MKHNRIYANTERYFKTFPFQSLSYPQQNTAETGTYNYMPNSGSV